MQDLGVNFLKNILVMLLNVKFNFTLHTDLGLIFRFRANYIMLSKIGYVLGYKNWYQLKLIFPQINLWDKQA